MSILPKPYTIGRLIFPRLIKRWTWLKYVPVIRRYAEGGDLSTPEKAAETQRRWEERR